MSLATAALALYHRTKAQYHQLTHPTAPAADHNHLQHPLAIAFPTHRTRAPRRRSRPLTTVIRYLLAAYPPAPRTAPPVVAKPACRLCAATTQPSPGNGGTRAVSPHLS